MRERWQDRLNFFFEGEPVGYFADGYPTSPGRYEYDPYRGEGHARFARALRRGPAECCFTWQGHELWLVITAEEFVEGRPGCQWFVRVSEVRTRPRDIRRRWDLDPRPRRHRRIIPSRRGAYPIVTPGEPGRLGAGGSDRVGTGGLQPGVDGRGDLVDGRAPGSPASLSRRHTLSFANYKGRRHFVEYLLQFARSGTPSRSEDSTACARCCARTPTA